MIEPSHRTLPPPTPARGLNGSTGHQRYGSADFDHPQYHHHNNHNDHRYQQRQQREPAGDCLVILPYSRSAFNSSDNGNGPMKCQCKSFFLSPGDPYSCLCGHPASCHSPDPPSSSSSSSDMSAPNSPSIPPISSITAAPLGNPFTEDGAQILSRITKLEQMLASEVHARHVLQANHRILQINHQRLADHCRVLEDEIGEVSGKVNIIEKVKEKTEKVASAAELLDERMEELEFRNEDLEKWVDKEEKRRKGVYVNSSEEWSGTFPSGGSDDGQYAASSTSGSSTIGNSATNTTASSPSLSNFTSIKSITESTPFLAPAPSSPSSKRRHSTIDMGATTTADNSNNNYTTNTTILTKERPYPQAAPKRTRTLPAS